MIHSGSYQISFTVIALLMTIIYLASADKNRAKKLHKISEIHYQSLVEHNPFLVFTVDNNGSITNVNPAGQQMLKSKKEQICSKTLFSFFNDEDHRDVERRFHHLQEEKPSEFEASLQDGEGNWIPMSITFIPIMVDEKMNGIFVIAKDNTDLVEYKERVKKAQIELIDTIRRQQGMTFKYKKIGDQYIHTLSEGELLGKRGLTSAMVVGKGLHAFLPKEYADTIHQAYSVAWNGEITDYEGHLNGIDYYVTLSPVIQNGKVIEVIGSGVDISERKKAERLMMETKVEAVRSSKAKSEFLSRMSHELRTPLNGILGFSQLLEVDETLNHKQNMFVQEILKGGRHLLTLINETLDLSQIESGKIRISKDAVKIGPILNECKNLIAPSAAAKGVIMINEVNHEQDCYVYGDQFRLRQIILNLMDNAIKYNRDKGKVVLTCKCIDDFLFLHIVDTGMGIPPSELRLIFEPFYRNGDLQIEGAGIGLSLVKQLIQLMGGDVGVESQLGEGSDFWVSLPLASSRKPYLVELSV
jgi:PAS domain S-box-containing protein